MAQGVDVGRQQGKDSAIENSFGEYGWLLPGLLAGCAIYASYLLTHPYPAYGAGLYLQTAESIAANGYHLPERIPYYAPGGIPFAYPPLMFYVTALLSDATGIDPLTFARVLPGLVTIAYLVPYYLLARELLSSPSGAGVATFLLAVCPPVLQWHLSAGGLVRAPAFLFTITGCYTAVRLFTSGSRRWLVATTLAFGLTVLTHPMYTVVLGASALLFYLGLDRSVVGFARGAAVAVGGLVLATPWAVTVASTHGVTIFTAAAGTHSGIFGGTNRIIDQFVRTLSEGPFTTLFYLGSYVGALYLIRERRFLLPAWLVSVAMLVGKERVQFIAGSMMAAVFVIDVLVPLFRERATVGHVRTVVTVLFVLGTVTAGTLYAAGTLYEHHRNPSQPTFMDADDREAMAWTASNTDGDASFAVAGDAAEWFPYFTKRTILVGPWGVEWLGHERYRRQLNLYKEFSECSHGLCLDQTLRDASVYPDYVYVPKDEYTVRGLSHEQSPEMRRSLVAVEQYQLVFENDGVMIFRIRGDASERPRNFPVSDHLYSSFRKFTLHSEGKLLSAGTTWMWLPPSPRQTVERTSVRRASPIRRRRPRGTHRADRPAGGVWPRHPPRRSTPSR